MLLVLLLTYTVATGKLRLLAGNYEGALNTALIGSMLSMIVSTLVALFGFYIINNAIAMDIGTGVHRVLASCPVSRVAYCFGKWLSSTAMLMIIVFTLFASALVVQLIRADVSHHDVVAMLALMIGIALPMMALVASCGLLVETLSFLPEGIGNMLWMPCFLAVLSGSVALVGAWKPALDPTGLELVRAHLVQCVSAVEPQYDGKIALTFVGSGNPKTIACGPMDWTLQLMMQRLALLGVGASIVLIAAWRFNRFSDSDRAPAGAGKKPRTRTIRRVVGVGASARHLMLEELRLMVLEGGMTWIVGVAICAVLALLVPSPAVDWVLLGAWILPALALSRLNCREHRHGTGDLLMTVSIGRLIASRWGAGVIALIVSASGVLIRHCLEGNVIGFWTVAASACFIASLAVACGGIAKSEKMFQVIYVVLIYIGPMNGVAHWNFVSAQDAWNAGRWLAYTAVALCIAVVARRLQERV